jgi:cob(I)alamin adenosyltransferase
MGNRLSKIYTRTGDDGTTGLGDGSRITKDDARVEAYGAVDELNSAVGVLIAAETDAELCEILADIQHQLFNLGGELCIPGSALISADNVKSLENILDKYNADLAPLKNFILPGGSTAGAACHMARAVCRRAERRICTLAANQDINAEAIHYINRLSDLLFVLARAINTAGNNTEVLWDSGRDKS